ncbi:MAG: endonuclease/exonuclease/phosphatase family protein [bacterium]|nr:endonuclease/exonuclease/phosphatase family protein [bacterium]
MRPPLTTRDRWKRLERGQRRKLAHAHIIDPGDRDPACRRDGGRTCAGASARPCKRFHRRHAQPLARPAGLAGAAHRHRRHAACAGARRHLPAGSAREGRAAQPGAATGGQPGLCFVFTSVDPVGGAKRYGNAILTRLPIVAQHEIKLPPLDDWRVAAHARLALPDGRTLDAYVTHLHHTAEGAEIRAEQIAGLIAFVDSTRADGPDAALLIGGDFNAEPDRLELAPMFERFTDVLATVHPELVLPAAATFGPATGTTPRRIDYLFCNGAQLVPTAARVVLGAPSPAGVWGSDHCGVWARFGAAQGTGR